MIHIGFTGPRTGMNADQEACVWYLVRDRTFRAHHGDCIGADAHFDMLVRGAPGLRGVVIWPSTVTRTRAYCQPNYPYDVVHPPGDPLKRDGDIVDAIDCLIATPRTTYSEIRSGTWATARYARERKKPIAFCFPNGALIYDGPEWP